MRRATLVFTIVLVSGCAVVRGPAPPAAAGVASWYGADFQGRRTASGERYDERTLTAASPSLPLGTRARVTNVGTGQSVDVRINDRGPFTRDRVLDVSSAAARRLGMVRSGTARVRVEVLDAAPSRTTPAPPARSGRRRAARAHRRPRRRAPRPAPT